MLPFKKIVTTSDFSDESQRGLRTAFELAVHFNAKLHLVHVVSPMPTIPGSSAPTGFHIPSVLKELQDIARLSLEKLVQKEALPGIETELQILTGDPAVEIVRFSDEIKADIIVMASHGQSGWRRFISGSVIEKAVRYASVPVLAVKSRFEDESEEEDR